MRRLWLITGVGGQLGRSFCALLHQKGEKFRSFDHAQLDISAEEAVRAELAVARETTPAGAVVLINAAAYTAVDRAESERETAQRINADAPGVLARLCQEFGIGFVQVSTDYVFDGEGGAAYSEDCATHPLSHYGASKLAGERAVFEANPKALVVRSSWLYGPGHNFIRTMLALASKRASGEEEGVLRVVGDQRGSPTYTADLAEGLLALVNARAEGLFHLANAGDASWWELARAAFDFTGYEDVEIRRISTEEYPTPAVRPRHTVLDCSKAEHLGVTLRPWREALAAYCTAEKNR